MNKQTKRDMINEMILEGTHSDNPQEELVWNEVAVFVAHEVLLKEAITAMDDIIRAARLARTKLRRLV